MKYALTSRFLLALDQALAMEFGYMENSEVHSTEYFILPARLTSYNDDQGETYPCQNNLLEPYGMTLVAKVSKRG